MIITDYPHITTALPFAREKGKTMIQIDIDMPKSCLRCMLAQPYADSPFWDVWCRPLERYIDERQTGKRQEDCPLKEVKNDEID